MEKRRSSGAREIRNVLFVLYSDFGCNSASHVHSLLAELVRLGHHCAVAVPFGVESAAQFSLQGYQPILFADAEAGLLRFPDGRGPDVVHAWTPRELVRKFCERLARIYDFQLFVHMEDNEWHLLSQLSGRSEAEIAKLSLDRLDDLVPDSLAHPVHGRRFMNDCSGVTLIVDRLHELVPPGVPSRVVLPSAQREIFFPRPLPKLDGSAFDIPAENTVVVYTGNVHPANAREVRSLYLAVAMLNREGFPISLVRTGRDFTPFLGQDDRWARQFSIELGVVARSDVASVMALADLFVQPGRADVFNDYRFPSKVPEFLSIGRPVVLPASNIAHQMTHGVHAWILENGDALHIAEAVRTIMGDPELYARLAAGAVQFFDERLNWASSARDLSAFYAQPAAFR